MYRFVGACMCICMFLHVQTERNGIVFRGGGGQFASGAVFQGAILWRAIFLESLKHVYDLI